MSTIVINGSPRKNGNTATILKSAVEGAQSCGVQAEMINLYDLNFKGCISCGACKLKDNKNPGKCMYKDELTPVLEKIHSADALIIGSPIYLGHVTGEVRSMLERLVFQYLVYDKNYSSLFDRKIPTGFVYTMNVTDDMAKQWGYNNVLSHMESVMVRTFGHCESIYATDTCQFDDYSKYDITSFDINHKMERKEKALPQECQKAFEMGVKFANFK